MLKGDTKCGSNGGGLPGFPYADISDIDSVESRLIEHMRTLFGQHYDAKLAATMSTSLVVGQKIQPYFNRRGVEFISIVKGAVIVNGRSLQKGSMVRIDPGEIVEIVACDDSELAGHIFPYQKALAHQPLPFVRRPSSPDTPAVSIVIIAKDIEHHVCQSILSAMEQSFTDLEIIVVDDGSTDHTVDKCRNMAHFDGRVKVYVQPMGRNGVRKFGVQKAQGQYCLIIDGDDWLNQDAIEKMMAAATEKKSDCVVFGFDHVSDRTSEVWNPVYPTDNHQKICPAYYSKDGQNALWASYLNHTIWMYFFSTKIKNNILDALVNIDLYEDLPFYFAVMQNAERPVLWNEVLYRYRRDRVGQSTANWGRVGVAIKLDSLEIAVDHCLAMIGDDHFLNAILLYKIRRIVDYELNVCIENADMTGNAAWEGLWHRMCEKFSSEISGYLIDKNVYDAFQKEKNLSR